ncbi:MAG: DNA mismatch repair endonuclease MutL [Rhodothermia bacterium]|nr:MAG: DNA mismatch repair endonuclease MutL [Rhodothermia bacterium]
MPEALANKIAAGEVVQRPASVVKELVENAIDAGAEHISVTVKGAGSELIQIADDGCGMSAVDAAVSFQRHATSKIRSIEDLESIRTLGFRGEALASIAAVGKVSLKSRRSVDEVGTEIVLEGGEVLSTSPKPMLPGSTISVRNLFYNVPARRKFLKRPATELKHIVDVILVNALANPRIAWTLKSGDNELLSVERGESRDPNEILRARVKDLLSLETSEPLITVEESTSFLKVFGILGKPELHKRTRGQQFLFVNNRAIKHRYLEHAVYSAYEYLIPEGTFPLFALFLDIDPRHIDVNVHPTKAEVKFEDESGVYSMMRTIVRKALGTAELTPDFLSAIPLSGIHLDMDSSDSTDSGKDSETPRLHGTSRTGFAYEPHSKSWLDAGLASRRLYDSGSGGIVASGTAESRGEDAREVESSDLLWQLHDAYVLTQIRSGLVIVDQQAAHERILYEKATNSLADGFGLSQQLLFPKTIEFPPGDFALLEELMPDLRSLGFDVEPFGGRSVVMRGVPADIRAGDERQILDAVLDQYKSFESVDKLTGRENLARSIARKSAVKAGVRLSHKEMRALIDQLFLCEMPYASPDGRPTIVKLSVDELRERFGQRG